MSRFNSEKTTVLAALREAAGLTQDEAAAYFGLAGKKRRDSLAAWERGTGAPHLKRRSKLILYLWDELGLQSNPERFDKLWNDVMVGEWGWLPLGPDEWPPTLASRRSDRHRKRAPFQAIRDLPHFVGRTRLITALCRALTAQEHKQIYCLEGPAGVGKTALAARLAYVLRSHFVDGVLWAELDSSDTMTILSAFAEAYGRNVSAYPNVESRSQVVRGLLANKHTLMILDRAERTTQVRPLLPPTGPCAVLVTTRSPNLSVTLTGQRFEICPFAKDSGDSLALFAHILGHEQVANERDALTKLAEMLGHLPLALDTVARQLACEPGWTAAGPRGWLHQYAEKLRQSTHEERIARLCSHFIATK